MALTALEPTNKISAVYDRKFQLSYLIVLTQYGLNTELHVTNPPSPANSLLEFQALLHNYIKAPSNEVLIKPLGGLTYYDKTEGRSKLEERNEVDVKQYTDAVYQDAPRECEVSWAGGNIIVKSTNLKDLVIWNPQQTGKNIGDMEAGGW